MPNVPSYLLYLANTLVCKLRMLEVKFSLTLDLGIVLKGGVEGRSVMKCLRRDASPRTPSPSWLYRSNIIYVVDRDRWFCEKSRYKIKHFKFVESVWNIVWFKIVSMKVGFNRHSYETQRFIVQLIMLTTCCVVGLGWNRTSEMQVRIHRFTSLLKTKLNKQLIKFT